MKKIVLIIAGAPRAGKDTFLVNYIFQAQELGKKARHRSSIDPIRDMLTNIGIDTSTKTDADRKLLAEVKSSLETHSNHCTKIMYNKIKTSLFLEDYDVFITQIREKVGIDTLKEFLANEENIKPIVVRIRNEVAEHNAPDNHADRDWINIVPDYDIPNNATLADLHSEVTKFVRSIFNEPEFN